jgi:hypothetical protein
LRVHDADPRPRRGRDCRCDIQSHDAHGCLYFPET